MTKPPVYQIKIFLLEVEPEVWRRFQVEGSLTLREAAPAEGASFRYVYDLGDNWTHEMRAERITIPGKPPRHPLCLARERRCPPEDCGGPPGYPRLLDALRDPEHPEHGDMVRWAGRRFDPGVRSRRCESKAEAAQMTATTTVRGDRSQGA